LPKLNLDFPEARDHIVDAAKYWLSLGLDGFRLDHVIGPRHAFWKYFRGEIKGIIPLPS
jgi:glycosidase